MTYYLVGIPLIFILSVLFGAIMAKKMESVGTGKVFGYLALALLTLLFVYLKLYLIQ